jgi:hypothetical protein
MAKGHLQTSRGVLGNRKQSRCSWRWAAVLLLGLASVPTLTGVALGAERAGAGSSGSPTYDPIIYVSPLGSDSNDGFSWTTAKATLANALVALPNCTVVDVKGKSWTLPCGQIEIDTGTLAIGSPVTITSPLISIIGRGSASTQLTWSGAGCAITVDSGNGNAITLPGPTFQGLSIDGTGNANTNSCGLHYQDSSHLVLRDMTISNFSASGDSCLYATPGASFAERVVLEHLFLGNCKVGWLLESTKSTFTTFGYGNFDLYINTEANQTGVKSVGSSSSADLRLKFSVFHIIVNSDDPSSTCASLTHYSHWADDTGVFRCDGPSHGFEVDDTSYFYFGGDLANDGGTSVANGGHLVVWETAQDSTTGYDRIIEGEKATADHPGTGPTWSMAGAYWDGNASRRDEWKFQQVPSQGASDLTVQHIAGPDGARFDVPGLGIFSGKFFGSPMTTIVAQKGGFYTFTLPAASGTAELAGANGVSSGTVLIRGGSGSHTFAAAYSTSPVCTATDMTSAAPVKVASAPTTVSVTGSEGDTVAWICAPATN